MFLWANVVVLGWLALAVTLLASHDTLGVPVWVAQHALLLGAATNAIVIWSEHFVVTLCRVPGPPPRRLALGLTALNVFIVTTLIGVVADLTVLSAVGGTGVAVIATVHTVHLFLLTGRALPGRFTYLFGYYAAAGIALILGAGSGAALAAGVSHWHTRLWAAHVHLTLLGWVGLSVLGTMFTLWPTTTATRITPVTTAAARRALPTLATGLLVAVGGMLTASVWVTIIGLFCYAAGVAVAIIPLWPPGLSPRGPAPWMLAAGTGWLAIAVFLDAGGLIIAGSVEALPDMVATVMPVLVVGFTTQMLLGALTQLLPVVLGRGPAEHRRIAEMLARGWQVRFAAVNLAVPLVAVDWPRPLPWLGWAFAALSVAAFLVLALRVAIPVARDGGLTPASDQRHSRGTTSGVLAGLITVALTVALAGSGDDTDPTPVSGEAHTVDITLVGMRVQPDTVDVPAGTRLVLRVTNQEAMPHDLRVDTGGHTPRLRQGQTALLDVGTVHETRQAWCTVAGHRAAGMTMTIRAHNGQRQHTETTPDSNDRGHNIAPAANPTPGWKPRDATLAATTEHRLELRAVEQDLEVAPGRRERRWTFAGTAPGPTLRGRVGDRFEITLINDTTMGHGLDFHAGALAPDQPMRTIAPGERLVYRFTAGRAGAWLYHCSAMPMSQHIANGMYGAVIIDPPDLPAVDREYLLISAQLYLGAAGEDSQVERIRAGRPDGWMFNGMPNQYDHAPLTAHPGQRVRIWLVNAGPGDSVAFHVVGAQFDTVYREGTWRLRPSETSGGAQVLDLAPAQGGFVELAFPEPGNYPFVDHDMRHAEGGAHGRFTVTERPR